MQIYIVLCEGPVRPPFCRIRRHCALRVRCGSILWVLQNHNRWSFTIIPYELTRRRVVVCLNVVMSSVAMISHSWDRKRSVPLLQSMAYILPDGDTPTPVKWNHKIRAFVPGNEHTCVKSFIVIGTVGDKS